MSLQESFRRVSQTLKMDPVVVSFYPYSELKHTWRYDRVRWEFKVSDYLEHASDEVFESLAWYLLTRATSLKCPDGRALPYLEYARSITLWDSARETYLRRSRSLCFEPEGKSHNLRTVFEYVNANYFSGRLAAPALAWTDESPRRRLGYYFEQLNLLAINRALDSDTVPRYALEFVMYHELLHHSDANGNAERTVRHTKAFREREKAFSAYSESQQWLRRLVGRAGHGRR